MRQNRVDPFGRFIQTPARGSLWGNRGALHNEKQEIVRPFRLEQWITCTLDYKGIRREIMAPNRLTELFFLDEATSFAAGHRPCALCRRTAYNSFKSSWLNGNPKYGFNIKTAIREIDHVLHIERMDKDQRKITFSANPSDLPNGSFVEYNGDPYLMYNAQCFKWSAAGYESGITIPSKEKLDVLTPRSVVHAFQMGYLPGMAIKP